MALKITKQTGGSFFFEPTSGADSTHKTVQYFEYGDKLTFIDLRNYVIEAELPFADLTVNDGTDDFTFDSGKLAIDKLVELGL